MLYSIDKLKNVVRSHTGRKRCYVNGGDKWFSAWCRFSSLQSLWTWCNFFKVAMMWTKQTYVVQLLCKFIRTERFWLILRFTLCVADVELLCHCWCDYHYWPAVSFSLSLQWFYYCVLAWRFFFDECVQYVLHEMIFISTVVVFIPIWR